MGVEPYRVVLPQHLDKPGRDPLGHDDRRPRAEPDDLHVLDLPEFAKRLLQQRVGNEQRVASGEQHITHLRGLPHVVDARLDLLPLPRVVGRSDDPAPAAVPAVHAALVGEQEQHPIGIPVRQSLVGGVSGLPNGVLHVVLRYVQLVGGRHGLPPDRTLGVVRVHERGVVRCDGHSQIFRRVGDLHSFRIGEVDDLSEGVDIGYPVPHLPLPVRPLLRADLLPERNVLVLPHARPSKEPSRR